MSLCVFDIDIYLIVGYDCYKPLIIWWTYCLGARHKLDPFEGVQTLNNHTLMVHANFLQCHVPTFTTWRTHHRFLIFVCAVILIIKTKLLWRK